VVEKVLTELTPTTETKTMHIVRRLRIERTKKRIEANRTAGRKQGIGNVIDNALVEIFGYEESKAYRTECLKSPRYAMLLVIAEHPEYNHNRLLEAVKKVANNPNTKAQF
tara:strand:- start:18 stop:347 length:330 start_codon:yes stop_codon:yes gene_type:complete